jgi:hypothetical protein
LEDLAVLAESTRCVSGLLKHEEEKKRGREKETKKC